MHALSLESVIEAVLIGGCGFLFAKLLATIAYFLKQKDSKIESIPSKGEAKLIEKRLDHLEKEIEKVGNKLEKNIEKLGNSIALYREEKHETINKLNIKNMENLLLADRLEKSDKVIEKAEGMINKLEVMLLKNDRQ